MSIFFIGIMVVHTRSSANNMMVRITGVHIIHSVQHVLGTQNQMVWATHTHKTMVLVIYWVPENDRYMIHRID